MDVDSADELGEELQQPGGDTHSVPERTRRGQGEDTGRGHDG